MGQWSNGSRDWGEVGGEPTEISIQTDDCDDGISGNNYMLWRIVRPEFSMSQYARDDGLSDINKHQLQRRT